MSREDQYLSLEDLIKARVVKRARTKEGKMPRRKHYPPVKELVQKLNRALASAQKSAFALRGHPEVKAAEGARQTFDEVWQSIAALQYMTGAQSGVGPVWMTLALEPTHVAEFLKYRNRIPGEKWADFVKRMEFFYVPQHAQNDRVRAVTNKSEVST